MSPSFLHAHTHTCPLTLLTGWVCSIPSLRTAGTTGQGPGLPWLCLSASMEQVLTG